MDDLDLADVGGLDLGSAELAAHALDQSVELLERVHRGGELPGRAHGAVVLADVDRRLDALDARHGRQGAGRRLVLVLLARRVDGESAFLNRLPFFGITHEETSVRDTHTEVCFCQCYQPIPLVRAVKYRCLG